MHLRLLAALFVLAHSAFAANNFYGINISSYGANGQCRNAGPWVRLGIRAVTEIDMFYPSAGWDSIVSTAKNNGYKRFRIYGNDCGTCGAISRSRV